MRRADIDALQLVLGRNRRSELGVLCLNLPEILHHLRAHVVIDLHELQVGLGDLARWAAAINCPCSPSSRVASR